MISLLSSSRIWLVAGVTDMCKSFNSLGELIQHALDETPFSGHLFYLPWSQERYREDSLGRC